MYPNIISHRLFVEALTSPKPSGKDEGRKVKDEANRARASVRPSSFIIHHSSLWPQTSFVGDWEHSVS
jgi:hypothetical protein